ncbi:MAG: tetratricopeptide repeat protein [Pseudomonadota bacterium]
MKIGKRIFFIFIGMVCGMFFFLSLCEALESPEFFFSKGVVAYSEGKFEEALGFFEKASQLHPEDAETQHYLGMTLTQLGKYDLAIASLEKALSLDPTIKEIHYNLGVGYFRAGDYAKALSNFMDAEKAQPDRAMLYFYQGYINYLIEKFDMVASPLNKAQELDPSLTQSCQFYRAMSLMKSKNYNDAEKEFQATIDTAPETELAEAAKSLKVRVAELRKQEKRWSIIPSISMQFDDNVTLEPDELPTAVRVSDEEDFRTVFHLIGEYRFFKNDCWSSVGRYTYYESLHSSLHDFDLIKNQVNLNLTRMATLGGLSTTLGFDVDYSHNLLDARSYLDTIHFRTTWGMNLKQNNFLQWQWKIQTKDFHYSIFNSQADRDGVNNLVGFNHFWFHCNNARYFRWGFLYDHDSTNGSDWDYDGYRFLMGYSLPLWKAIKLKLDGEYFYQDYKNSDSVYNQERSDREYTWSVSFNRDFRSNLNLALQYLGRQHDSNIEFYEYDRNVYMLTLTAYF